MIPEFFTLSSPVVWDMIVKIELLPPEQVWDIEVEGTHNFVAGHYMNKVTGKVLTQAQEDAYARWREIFETPVVNANDDAYVGIERHKLLNQHRIQIQLLRTLLNWRSLFISWKNNDSYKYQHNTQADGYAGNPQRKFFKEVTEDAAYNNRFADIGNNFSDEFNFVIIHQNKDYHVEKDLSTFIIQNERIKERNILNTEKK